MLAPFHHIIRHLDLRAFPTLGAAAALGCAFTVAGCEQQTTVRLAPRAGRAPVAFIVTSTRGRPTGLGVFRVDSCARGHQRPGPLMWLLTPTQPGQASLRRVDYGKVPAGFKEQSPAKPLAAGCYLVSVSGTGQLKFAIDSSGVASPGPGGTGSPT